MTHLGADTILKRLPSVYEIGHNFANVDITKEPIPVVPTIHYQMGGIPTNIHGQVVVPEERQTRTRWSTACTRWASAPASACTAPTAWAPTRCSTCWCSAARPATTSSTAGPATKRTSRCRPDAADRTLARPPRRTAPTPASIRAGRRQRPRAMQQHAGVFRTRPDGRGRGQGHRAIAERVRASTWPTSPRSSTPRASRRWRSRT